MKGGMYMERLRLWLSLTQDEKFAAAERELKGATLDIHEDFEEEWSLSRSVEDFAPSGLAELISWAAECLLGLQWQLEWDFDADVEDMFLSKGVTTYWFRVFDPETGCILTRKPNGIPGARFRYCKFIETLGDAVQAVVDLADIIAENLPVVRSQVSPIKEVK
jgi:hypothetical protein